MRNISFQLTTEQIRNRTKTVTRRLGWEYLKPGTLLQACEKCMGLKKGEHLNKLAVIRVTNVYREPLNEIAESQIWAETRREGFPNISPEAFVEMFCKHMKCNPYTIVTRIEFEYVQ